MWVEGGAERIELGLEEGEADWLVTHSLLGGPIEDVFTQAGPTCTYAPPTRPWPILFHPVCASWHMGLPDLTLCWHSALCSHRTMLHSSPPEAVRLVPALDERFGFRCGAPLLTRDWCPPTAGSTPAGSPAERIYQKTQRMQRI